jgi:hypothetical protein
MASSKTKACIFDPDERYASLLNTRVEERITEGLRKLCQLHPSRISNSFVEQTFIACLNLSIDILTEASSLKLGMDTLTRINAFKETISHVSSLIQALTAKVHFKHDGLQEAFLRKVTHRLMLALEDLEAATSILGETAVSGLIGVLESVWSQNPAALESFL